MTNIHSTAIIHPSARLHDRVEIGPYTIIGEDVEIGSNTYVGPHCVIEFSTIGRNNHITASSFIGTPPQDFKYHGEKTSLVIGDNNIIREGVSLHRGSTATGVTVIGSNCMFMAYAHIGHDCRIGNGVIMANSAEVAGHVEIGNNAFISSLIGIHQFARIGSLVMLGAGSMVSLDIPPFCTAQGDRAKLVGLNIIGLRRAGISGESIKSIKHVYKTLFLSNLSLKDAFTELRDSNLSHEAESMVHFCEDSKRGIARPRNKSKTDFNE
ncbi:MAG: acyl-ACP--UDP-N-acetylglucosamine O-acyltransferase [Candidatus Eremiobacterota bacterium]